MIILPARFTQRYIENHPQWIFVYGDAFEFIVQRKGTMMGQSAFAAPYIYQNCFPVSTKYSNCKSSAQAFLHDINFDFFKKTLDADIKLILEHQKDRPIILFPKIGCGCAQLDTRPNAARCFDYLNSELNKIKSEQKINYKIPIE